MNYANLCVSTIKRLVKTLISFFFLGLLTGALSCGNSAAPKPQSGPLSGNWLIALRRHVLPVPPLIFSGFLVQSGNSVTGAVRLGSNCSGVGSVTGTVDGNNVTLTINESGEDISLQGSIPTISTPMAGQFSNLAGGCTAYANTGTWFAVQIAPITGTFHGTFTSTANIGNPTISVTGNLEQGANTGSSTATLTGAITAATATGFCSYLSSATITGLISGNAVILDLYGPDGSEIAQFGNMGIPPEVKVTPEGTSISGAYAFPSISSSCPGDLGTFQLTFP